MQKKKPFKNALNNIGPIIEPCGTLEIMSLKLHCWRVKRCGYEHIVYGFSNTCKYISECPIRFSVSRKVRWKDVI